LIKYIGLGIGGRAIYAIIETGGKQYRVTPGQTLDVALLDKPEGDSVEISRVLLIADGDNMTVGKPLVEGAKVMATYKAVGRTKKSLAGKFMRKTRYARKLGSRQYFTTLVIDQITGPGLAASEPAKKPRRKKAAPIETKTEVKENGA